ncbi:MAG: hypothetical protein COV66_00380 [Nitrospinae bacterium CG11_big_fil_rev_8_21_14_0_20_45_15]|nr:MAG: hypothetical protein COV66_00380 [Nitrospinae bacterium CG11_big_fil_rev_8_21_14_0_20_45_15]
MATLESIKTFIVKAKEKAKGSEGTEKKESRKKVKRLQRKASKIVACEKRQELNKKPKKDRPKRD